MRLRTLAGFQTLGRRVRRPAGLTACFLVNSLAIGVRMPIIDRFFDPGPKFLGSRYPVMCGAMTWISDPGLTIRAG